LSGVRRREEGKPGTVTTLLVTVGLLPLVAGALGVVGTKESFGLLLLPLAILSATVLAADFVELASFLALEAADKLFLGLVAILQISPSIQERLILDF
jgi:hypothetical protein